MVFIVYSWITVRPPHTSYGLPNAWNGPIKIIPLPTSPSGIFQGLSSPEGTYSEPMEVEKRRARGCESGELWQPRAPSLPWKVLQWVEFTLKRKFEPIELSLFCLGESYMLALRLCLFLFGGGQEVKMAEFPSFSGSMWKFSASTQDFFFFFFPGKWCDKTCENRFSMQGSWCIFIYWQ